MIVVQVDLSQATSEEQERFFALPGVGRALDALAHEGKEIGVFLRLCLSTDAPPPWDRLPAACFTIQ